MPASNTDLMKAIENSDYDMVTALIDAGAKVNAIDEDPNGFYETPLIKAFHQPCKNSKIIQKLISAGANINDCDRCGRTALICLILMDYRNNMWVANVHNEPIKTIMMLIVAGANVNTQDRYGRTPLMEVLRSMEHHEDPVDIAHRDKQQYSVQIKQENKIVRDIVWTLIAARADVNLRSDCDTTALMLAAHVGHMPALSSLIIAGANINAQDKSGNTAIISAVMAGQREAVKMLINAKADVNRCNKQGRTPLMIAALLEYRPDPSCHYGHDPITIEKIITILLAARADVNVQDVNGNTAGMLAVKNKRIDIAKQLITAETNVYLTNHDGESILSLAVHHQLTEIVNILNLRTITRVRAMVLSFKFNEQLPELPLGITKGVAEFFIPDCPKKLKMGSP